MNESDRRMAEIATEIIKLRMGELSGCYDSITQEIDYGDETVYINFWKDNIFVFCDYLTFKEIEQGVEQKIESKEENQELKKFSDFLNKEQSYCTEGNQIYIDIIDEFDKTQEKVEKQIAMLQDGLEYQKDMADTYAKSLKRIYDLIDDLIDEFENADGICISDLKELKNSIPETALKRGE